MNIYLDSRDLIAIAERWEPAAADAFEEKLRLSKSELIFALENITEICAALVKGDERSSVMRTLNRIERMPHRYWADSRIVDLELREAARAFAEDRDFVRIVEPLVLRFDCVISPFQAPATRDYLVYGLAHTVWELWGEDKSLLVGNARQAKKLQELLEADRMLRVRDADAHFPTVVARNLDLYGIPIVGDRRKFGEWIYADPQRCPAHRLGFELHLSMVNNKTDKGHASDLADLQHLVCLPYVDAMTMDRRMRGYVEQVDKALGTTYSQRLFEDAEAIAKLISNA